MRPHFFKGKIKYRIAWGKVAGYRRLPDKKSSKKTMVFLSCAGISWFEAETIQANKGDFYLHSWLNNAKMFYLVRGDV